MNILSYCCFILKAATILSESGFKWDPVLVGEVPLLCRGQSPGIAGQKTTSLCFMFWFVYITWTSFCLYRKERKCQKNFLWHSLNWSYASPLNLLKITHLKHPWKSVFFGNLYWRLSSPPVTRFNISGNYEILKYLRFYPFLHCRPTCFTLVLYHSCNSAQPPEGPPSPRVFPPQRSVQFRRPLRMPTWQCSEAVHVGFNSTFNRFAVFLHQSKERSFFTCHEHTGRRGRARTAPRLFSSRFSFPACLLAV